MEADKPNIRGAGWPTRDLGRVDAAAQVQRQPGGRLPSPSGTSVCILLKPSTHLLHETHTHDGGESPLLKIHLFK